MLVNVLNHLDLIEKVKGHNSLRVEIKLSVTDLKELSLEEGSINHVSALLQIFVSIVKLSNEMTR